MRTILLLVISIAITGCASIARGTKDALEVQTNPAGASCVSSTGHQCPSTPCVIKMPRRSEGVLTCSKTGYKDATGNFTHKTSGGGAAGMAGNVILGGLIGAAVDAGTGATQDLAPNPLVITLEKTDGGTNDQ